MDRRRSETLAAGLRRTIVDQRFDEVLDTTPPGGGEPARIHQMPNLDVAVVELAPDGQAVSAANVLLSPRYPDGAVVPLDANLCTDQVRWRCWDDDEWDLRGGDGTID